jgi:hypothetical protein
MIRFRGFECSTPRPALEKRFGIKGICMPIFPGWQEGVLVLPFSPPVILERSVALIYRYP